MATQFSLQDCQDSCENCHRLCMQTLVHAMRQHGRPVHESHLRLLLDCAEICQACVGFLLRGSELAACVCRACATICERCAEFCGERRNDAQMRQCERACLHCSACCAQMAA